MMKKVQIVPPWDWWLDDKMFKDAEGCVYTDAFALWQKRAADAGYHLETWTPESLQTASCVWFMDLPRRKAVFDRLKGIAPLGSPFVLQVLESPVLTPHSFVEQNRIHFDAVVSYETALSPTPSRFNYCLPNKLSKPQVSMSYKERRTCVMVNSNRVEGYFGVRQRGMEGLPGIGRYFSGWKTPRGHLLAPAKGELYSWRRALAQAADALETSSLDVFGQNWNGESISWFNAYPNRPYRCASNGKWSGDKLELLSRYRFGIGVENFRGDLGYISEKVFDVLSAGAVPVYLGEENIAEQLPVSAFVDARKFSTCRELLNYLEHCPEYEWLAMRDAGQDFLRSCDAQIFGDEVFAQRMVECLTEIVGG